MLMNDLLTLFTKFFLNDACMMNRRMLLFHKPDLLLQLYFAFKNKFSRPAKPDIFKMLVIKFHKLNT